MYAVIKTGGKQYKVVQDDVIAVEKLDIEPGKKVDFDVLFFDDGKTSIFDAATLAKAKVTGEVVEQFKGDKQLVFKFKRRKGYKRLRGHRQNLTKVRIVKIGKPTAAKAAPKTDAKTDAKASEKPAAKKAADTKPAAKKAPAKTAAKPAAKPAAKKATATKAAAKTTAKPAAKKPAAKKAPAKAAADKE